MCGDGDLELDIRQPRYGLSVHQSPAQRAHFLMSEMTNQVHGFNGQSNVRVTLLASPFLQNNTSSAWNRVWFEAPCELEDVVSGVRLINNTSLPNATTRSTEMPSSKGAGKTDS